MGQYYHPTSINRKQNLYSHDYDSGLKLMEHSWLQNDFVHVVETLLAKGGSWYKNKIVWAGDYADNEPETDSNWYSMGETIKPKHKPNPTLRYIVNHSKKLYVDKFKLKPMSPKKWLQGESWTIHPLPLLTAEGNGQGGGDYNGMNMDLVGSWARDIISTENRLPRDYSELTVYFDENN